jgi:hypothetical protein
MPSSRVLYADPGVAPLLPWRVGERVRFEDPETPRPIAEQLRGTIAALNVQLTADGLAFTGPVISWDDCPEDLDDEWEHSLDCLKREEAGDGR